MKKIKLILVILVSFYISSFLNDHVFFADTPKLKPFIAERFLKYLSSLVTIKEKNIVLHDKESFHPISKGIYAKEMKGGKVILIKDNEIVWKIYQYEINGKKISIKVPENEQTPDEDIVKKIFNNE